MQPRAAAGIGNAMGIRILGMGSYVPPLTVDNEAFTSFLDTSDEWITTRSGIKTRHVADGELTVEMGVKAARKALEDAGIDPQEVDLILFSSVTADFYTPSMACIAQGMLGIQECMAIDLNCACAGCVYAIDMARRYLATGDVKKVLVICAERLSQISNYEDRSTCVLFGDGAAAYLLEGAGTLYTSYMGADGTGAHLLFAKKPELKTVFMQNDPAPLPEGYPDWPDGFVYMDGREVYKFATRVMPHAVEKAAEKAGIPTESIDLLIPHQANIRIIKTAAQKLHIPMEKVFCNLDKYANTSSASIPLACEEARRLGRMPQGSRVCLVGFGAGLTYGAIIFDV